MKKQNLNKDEIIERAMKFTNDTSAFIRNKSSMTANSRYKGQRNHNFNQINSQNTS